MGLGKSGAAPKTFGGKVLSVLTVIERIFLRVITVVPSPDLIAPGIFESEEARQERMRRGRRVVGQAGYEWQLHINNEFYVRSYA